MNILYTCDNNYVWLMGISVISLFENNKTMGNLNVYLLGENISKDNKHILRDIAKEYNRKIIVIDIPQIEIPATLVTSRWPLSAFTRLYAGELLPKDIKRILYLDCDTIIKGKLDKLESLNITDSIIWGVKDCVGKYYKENIGLRGDSVYINAGVLYINLENLRKIDLTERINRYLERYVNFINYADQDVLNGVFYNEIGVLPPQYDVMTIALTFSYKDIISLRKPTNYYSEQELKFAANNPLIIHYTTNMRTVRPWYSNSNHPFKEEFIKYFNLSPWKYRSLPEMKFTTMEYRIIGLINMLPSKISKSLLGFLHTSVKPLIIRLKAR